MPPVAPISADPSASRFERAWRRPDARLAWFRPAGSPPIHSRTSRRTCRRATWRTCGPRSKPASRDGAARCRHAGGRRSWDTATAPSARPAESAFLRLLASDYDIDQGAVRTLAAAVVEAEAGEALDAAEDELRSALVAPPRASVHPVQRAARRGQVPGRHAGPT